MIAQCAFFSATLSEDLNGLKQDVCYTCALALRGWLIEMFKENFVHFDSECCGLSGLVPHVFISLLHWNVQTALIPVGDASNFYHHCQTALMIEASHSLRSTWGKKRAHCEINYKHSSGSFIHQSGSFCQLEISFPWLHLTVHRHYPKLLPIHFLLQKYSWICFSGGFLSRWRQLLSAARSHRPLWQYLKDQKRLHVYRQKHGRLSSAVWLMLFAWESWELWHCW